MVTPENELQPFSGADATVGARLEVLWCEILRVKEIRPDDTFIDLGGESLSATLCTNRIEAVFGVQIPLGVLLAEETTMASLTARIEASADPGAARS